MKRAWAAALGLAATVARGEAAPDLAHCTAIDDPVRRLACYDAQAGRVSLPKPPAAPAPSPDAAAPPAPADSAAPAPAAAPSLPAAERFGLPAPAGQQAEALQAHIDGAFDGWTRGQMVKLDNGQVWKCVDDRDGYYPNTPRNAEVTISRSFFGGYWLEIKATGARLRVKRIR